MSIRTLLILLPLGCACCQGAPPACRDPVTSASIGQGHTLARRQSGLLSSWGSNDQGELGSGDMLSEAAPVLRRSPSGVTSVAAGEHFSVALLDSGDAVAWGGRVGPIPTTLAVRAITQVAAGGGYRLAVARDGSLLEWGSAPDGPRGGPDIVAPSRRPEFSGIAAVAISPLGDSALALRADGGVVAWGRARAGQLGDGTSFSIFDPEPVRGPRPVALGPTVRAAAIAAGAQHGLALTRTGAVWAWGSNRQGQLGIGRISDIENRPLLVTLPARAISIAAGGNASYAVLADGRVLSWGDRPPGDGTASAISPAPTIVPGLPHAQSVVAGAAIHNGISYRGGGGPPNDRRDSMHTSEMALVRTDDGVFSWGAEGLTNIRRDMPLIEWPGTGAFGPQLTPARLFADELPPSFSGTALSHIDLRLDGGNLVVSWEAATPATGRRIRVYWIYVNGAVANAAFPPATTAVVSGLEVGRTYEVSVRAVDTAGLGTCDAVSGRATLNQDGTVDVRRPEIGQPG